MERRTNSRGSRDRDGSRPPRTWAPSMPEAIYGHRTQQAVVDLKNSVSQSVRTYGDKRQQVIIRFCDDVAKTQKEQNPEQHHIQGVARRRSPKGPGRGGGGKPENNMYI